MNGEQQKEMFHLASAGAVPALVTTDEIDFDAEPAVPVPLEPNEPQGAAVQSPVAGQDEQRAGGVPVGQPQGGDEPQRSEEGTNGRSKEPDQMMLLRVPEWWQEHWKGMPEFGQEDLTPYKTILVHFENKSDMEKFARLTEQNVNLATKCIWYPRAEIDEVSKLRWIANPKVDNGKKEELMEILDGE